MSEEGESQRQRWQHHTTPHHTTLPYPTLPYPTLFPLPFASLRLCAFAFPSFSSRVPAFPVCTDYSRIFSKNEFCKRLA
jgi:hypothetical protein